MKREPHHHVYGRQCRRCVADHPEAHRTLTADEQQERSAARAVRANRTPRPFRPGEQG